METRPDSPLSPVSSLSPASPSPASPSPVPSSPMTPYFTQKDVKRRNTSTPLRKRGTRCLECAACLRQFDCGKCVNCM